MPGGVRRIRRWFVVGIVIYAAYGYRHSKLGRGEVVQTDRG
jgi:APA family basic amino acid/polyamine antiporter